MCAVKSPRPHHDAGAPGGAFDSDDGTDPSRGAGDGFTEEQDAIFRPGTLIEDRYRIESLLGEGGMAYVYRARDERYGRPVALKIMRLTVMGHIALLSRHCQSVRTNALRVLARPAVSCSLHWVDTTVATWIMLRMASEIGAA